jgi:hypothetical protein
MGGSVFVCRNWVKIRVPLTRASAKDWGRRQRRSSRGAGCESVHVATGEPARPMLRAFNRAARQVPAIVFADFGDHQGRLRH